jgi:hypothetical protein
MNSIKTLIITLLSVITFNAFSLDVFPKYETGLIVYSVPTNTPGCFSDPDFLVGTNYVYKLKGQVFLNPLEGHIQTLSEGFSGKSDESTPWKTLSELLATYQKGSSESEIRAIYSDLSGSFLSKVYSNEQMKSRYQAVGLSIVNMQAVLGYYYADGYLAQVRLTFKDGRQEVSQFYFVTDGVKYKMSSLRIKKMDPSLINIGLFLNKKPRFVLH